MVQAAALHTAGAPRAAASSGGVARVVPLALSKHDAAGNDFLVLVDEGGERTLSPAQVRAVCDRRRGVGADGLIVLRAGTGEADLEMVLFNADGSRAEMSGNGIRCLAQAAVMAGIADPGTLRVRTGAGVRSVDYRENGGVATASVDMGPVDLGDDVESPLPGARARAAHVGNPHVVIVTGAATGAAAAAAEPGGNPALAGIDLAALSRAVTTRLGEDVNVEVVRTTRPRRDSLVLRVFERGVGETAACGTGSCAAAMVARSFGLVGDEVVVENPGGTLTVRLGAAAADSAFLEGPVRHVADVVIAPSVLDVDAGA